MSKHKILKEQKKIKQKSLDEVEYSAKVERIYKISLRIMSWIVGIAIFLVIILFYFNSPAIDVLSQVIFYIGIITLIVFLVIELVGNNVKNMISKIVDKVENAKSPVD